MYKKTVLYNNVEKLINSIDIRSDNEGTEMDNAELSFLCGLIKEKKPQKILELGVSAGGTTAVILKLIEELGLHTQVISIDKAEKYYIDPNKNVGYLVGENKEALGTYGQWKLYCGRSAEKFIEEVGKSKDIDFCIIDTAHRLPGEVLDFLICYPYLTDNATVVVHDLILNYYGSQWAISSKLLFDTVVGEKYLMWNIYEPAGYPSKYPNIGAFEILPETKKYIMNVLSVLTVEWGYGLSETEIREIKRIFHKNYDDQFCSLFEEIVNLQTKLVAGRIIKQHTKTNEGYLALLKEWKASKKTALYGAGTYCKKYLEFAKAFGYRVDIVVVSDEKDVPENDFVDCPICHVSEVEQITSYNFIVCINAIEERKEIEKSLRKKGCKVLNAVFKDMFFYFDGNKYELYEHSYNCGFLDARMTERSIELPLAKGYLDNLEEGKIVEVGAVTPYYFVNDKIVDIVDPTDVHNRVTVRKSLFECDFREKNVLSISTIEHVGLQEYGMNEKKNVIDALQKILTEAKSCFITAPLGYNALLDSWVRKNWNSPNIKIMKREKDNHWIQIDSLIYEDIKYGPLWANGLAIITKNSKDISNVWKKGEI